MKHASSPARPLVLHGLKLSGHSHRAELFLSLLGLPYRFIEVDFAGGALQRPDFLALNPYAQVPVLEDGETVIADSVAILVYLASRYAPGRWLPADALGQARVQRWLSVAQGPLAYGAAAARLITVFGADFRAEEVIARAHRMLGVMEQALAGCAWLAGDTPSLADVALYSYVDLAPEGNVSLQAYPNVQAWLARIEALPGFLPMPHTAVGLRA